MAAAPAGAASIFPGDEMASGLRDVVDAEREAILALAMKHGAFDVSIFGSVARGEADAMSDIDFLVSFEHGRSLLDHIALEQDLTELLGAKVDVVSRGGLSPYLRDAILREAIPV